MFETKDKGQTSEQMHTTSYCFESKTWTVRLYIGQLLHELSTAQSSLGSLPFVSRCR